MKTSKGKKYETECKNYLLNNVFYSFDEYLHL